MRRKRNRRAPATRGRSASGDPQSQELLAALALLSERRAPYAELLSRIVQETLQEFPPASPGASVEIGSGIGQLREWLPENVRATIVHTDPSREVLRVLSTSAPEASVAIASGDRLPFANGALGAVLSLCVFDAIAEGDQEAVVAEMARVLGPGGRFVHFLDMATLLDAPFKKLVASGLVPLPNVFGDPADQPSPSDGRVDSAADWPRDILLVKREWLVGLLDFTRRVEHPLSHAFGEYFAAFLPSDGSFDAGQATRVFKALASSGESRRSLAELLTSACRLGFQWGYPAIDALPFHSGRYLASVLEAHFRDSGAFQISRSRISARAAWRPLRGDGDPRYRSLCLGHQRLMDQVPGRLLSESAREWAAARQLAPATLADGEALVEAGVFVFVATRL